MMWSGNGNANILINFGSVLTSDHDLITDVGDRCRCEFSRGITYGDKVYISFLKTTLGRIKQCF